MFRVFLFQILFILPLSVFATEEALRMVPLTKREEVVKEYCRTETGTQFDCMAPAGVQLVLIYLSKPQGEKMAVFVNEALRRGYAEELSLKDFFHGHMILQGPRTGYASAVDFLNDVRLVLFHSAESNRRWFNEGERGLSTSEKTPRSFVGWMNGLFQKAVDAVLPTQRLKQHERTGTIYNEEIVQSNPGTSLHHYQDYGRIEDLFIQTDFGRCRADNQMYILPEAEGRFQTSQGQKFELYFRCLLL